MGEKKEIKIGLGTVICLIIIVILIVAIIGLWFYYNPMHTSNNNNLNTVATVSTEQTEENTTEQKNNIIMYKNMDIANAKPGTYAYEGQFEKFEVFYNTTYDIYVNGKKQGKTRGTVVEYEHFTGNKCYAIGYDETSSAYDKETILVSCNYNVVPRNSVDETNIPYSIQSHFYNCDSIKMQSIDLDGDGEKEYLVSYSKVQDELSEISGISLFDSNFNKISNIAEQYSQYLSDFDGVTYMDIDNDDNMEIIIDIPLAASLIRFGVYKYVDNTIQGQIMTFGLAP